MRRARRLLVAIAGAGVVETAALVALIATGGAPCAIGTRANCAALHATGEGALLGLPLPLLGLSAYAAMALLAVQPWRATPRRRAQTWRVARWLAAAMALFSVHLLGRLVALQSPCPWCLGSAALSLALLAVAMPWRRGVARVLRVATPGLVLGASLVVAAQVARIAVPAPAASAALSPADAALAQRLAAHLRATGAVLYGVWWCPDCALQKERFGAAAAQLPYREADAACEALGINTFPTWVIGGTPLHGLQTLGELAARSGLPVAAEAAR